VLTPAPSKEGVIFYFLFLFPTWVITLLPLAPGEARFSSTKKFLKKT
jgi:hypothetical protein